MAGPWSDWGQQDGGWWAHEAQEAREREAQQARIAERERQLKREQDELEAREQEEPRSMGSDIDRDEERARLQEVSDLLEEEKAALCDREAIR